MFQFASFMETDVDVEAWGQSNCKKPEQFLMDTDVQMA